MSLKNLKTTLKLKMYALKHQKSKFLQFFKLITENFGSIALKTFKNTFKLKIYALKHYKSKFYYSLT